MIKCYLYKLESAFKASSYGGLQDGGLADKAGLACVEKLGSR